MRAIDPSEWGRDQAPRDRWGKPLVVEEALNEVHQIHNNVVNCVGQHVDIAVGSGSSGDGLDVVVHVGEVLQHRFESLSVHLSDSR